MTVVELAKRYYPRLWDKTRIEALVAAGRLSKTQADKIMAAAEKASEEG